MAARKKALWYEKGLCFQCRQCGSCCGKDEGYIWVTRDEIVRLAEFLSLTVEDFSRQFLRRCGRRHSLIEKTNYDCCMLERGRCRIYPVRPVQCRTYPFWKEVVSSPDAWAAESARCPGINQGPLYIRQEIETIAADS